ncbi:MAG: hypothetical protein ACRCYX_10650 [Dermatophilaceae bacterium]
MTEGPSAGPHDSILAGMTPIDLGPDAEEEYEATRRLLEQVVGLASSRRFAAEQSVPVDDAALQAADELDQHFAPLMVSLDPTDTAEVARVRAECVALLRRARGLDA